MQQIFCNYPHAPKKEPFIYKQPRFRVEPRVAIGIAQNGAKVDMKYYLESRLNVTKFSTLLGSNERRRIRQNLDAERIPDLKLKMLASCKDCRKSEAERVNNRAFL